MFRRLLIFWAVASGMLLHAGNVLTKAHVKGDQLVLHFAHVCDPGSIRMLQLKGSGTVRYVFDLAHTRIGSSRVPRGLKHPRVRSFRISQYHPHTVRIVIETSQRYRIRHNRPSSNSYTITLPPASKKSISSLFAHLGLSGQAKVPHNPQGQTYHQIPQKTTRLKATQSRHHASKAVPPHRRRYTVILDPGHGGHDTGAIGGKRREKDAVLQIARRVKRHLERMGVRVVATRNSDHFVPLRNRTRYANRKHGDIFVSIHANAIAGRKKRSRHGVETFFLQTTRSDRAKRVAARENSVVLRRSDRMSKNVILNAVMTGPKIVLSNKLAIDVQRHILGNLRKKYRNIVDGGVRPAPFWVLVGAEMPAVLVETGYISNPMERRRLFNGDYQDRLAKGIAEGVVNYLRNRERELQ